MSTQSMTRIIADYFSTQPIVKAWLFGSFARGEETPTSDVDILVEYDRTQRIGLMKIARIHVELERLLGSEVDLVERDTVFPWLAASVDRDKKLIYERAN